MSLICLFVGFFINFDNMIVGDVADVVIDIIVDDGDVKPSSTLYSLVLKSALPFGLIFWTFALTCVDIAYLVAAVPCRIGLSFWRSKVV
jgi:hypothetical protein